jgi:hypothetical protein
VATHFSCLLRHAWVTVGLFLAPGHHTGITLPLTFLKSLVILLGDKGTWEKKMLKFVTYCRYVSKARTERTWVRW